MAIALWFILITLVGSAVYTAVLIREYLKITRKRRELIAALGGSGRAVPRFKHTLMSIYVIATVVWSLVFIFYYFSLI